MASPLAHRAISFTGVVDRITHNVHPSRTHVRRMQSTVAALGSSVSSLVAQHGAPDPTRTTAMNYKKLAENAAKLEQRRNQTFQELQSVWRQGLVEIQSRKDAKVSLKPGQYAEEVRAAFRGMSPAERLKALGDLAAKNDGPTLAAITEAPSILSGVSEEHQVQFRDLIVSTHAAAELAEETELMDAFKSAVVATDVAGKLAADLSNPERLAEIEKGVAAAADAEAAFNSSAKV